MVMSNVNWFTWTFQTTVLPFPTYGNYGGRNYANGEINGNGFDKTPKDELDKLFKAHDVAYTFAENEPAGQKAADIFAADKALISSIEALKLTAAWQLMSPDEQGYGNLTEIAFSLKNGLSPPLSVTPTPVLAIEVLYQLYRQVFSDAAGKPLGLVGDAQAAVSVDSSGVMQVSSNANGVLSIWKIGLGDNSAAPFEMTNTTGPESTQNWRLTLAGDGSATFSDRFGNSADFAAGQLNGVSLANNGGALIALAPSADGIAQSISIDPVAGSIAIAGLSTYQAPADSKITVSGTGIDVTTTKGDGTVARTSLDQNGLAVDSSLYDAAGALADRAITTLDGLTVNETFANGAATHVTSTDANGTTRSFSTADLGQALGSSIGSFLRGHSLEGGSPAPTLTGML